MTIRIGGSQDTSRPLIAREPAREPWKERDLAPTQPRKVFALDGHGQDGTCEGTVRAQGLKTLSERCVAEAERGA